MGVTTYLLLIAAVLIAAWLVLRARQERGRQGAGPATRADLAEHLAPKPLAPRFQVDGWDGYIGMQMALCIALAEKRCYPLIEAGTIPPVTVTHTFSTSRPEQTHLRLVLYASRSERIDRAQIVAEASIGPIPLTGEAIREIETAITVDENGVVGVSTRNAADGVHVDCAVAAVGLGAVPIGPSR